VWYTELQALRANYVIIKGEGQERYDNAVKAIDAFVNIKAS